MRHLKVQSGISLVEMIIYIALISVALVSITGFSDNLTHGRVKARSIEEVQQDARFIMHRISVAFHNATDIDETNTTLDSDDGQLMLEVGGDTFLFSLNSEDQMTITEGSGSAEAISTDKTAVTQFLLEDRTPNGDGTEITDLKITMTVDHTNPTGASEFRSSTTVQTTVSLRP